MEQKVTRTRLCMYVGMCRQPDERCNTSFSSRLVMHEVSRRKSSNIVLLAAVRQTIVGQEGLHKGGFYLSVYGNDKIASFDKKIIK